MKTRKMTDRMLLESLLNKYGVKKITNVINKINENYNYNSGIFIESHDHLNCDAFRILVLDNGVNVLKNNPLEIECLGQYSGKKYIETISPKHNNPYVEINYVGNVWEESLCLIKVVKTLNIKYPKLPIYCFTEGWNTWKGAYENVEKFFNSIFSKELRGISFDFINGTMQDFLNNNVNESFHINENQDNIQVLYDSLPEAYDDYRDAYEEDIEVGDIDPNEDYGEYLSRMRDMETEDLEANINIADGKYGYYYTVCKNPDDNSVSNDLWDAIYELVDSEYCKISFVNDHIEVEVAHYNSQNRSYYKIYALNQKGCDLYEDDEDVYYGHDMAKLNNPKYFRRMEPIM